jgi:cobalt/nickel transport protein
MSHMLVRTTSAAMLSLFFTVVSASAHFGTLIPDKEIVSQGESRIVSVDAKFIHPMEGHYMQMDRPAVFGVLARGKWKDLLPMVRENKVGGFSTWSVQYEIERPGDHIFYIEPTPYWEPAEERFIVHFTKVVVNAYGLENSWDTEVGLKTEIVPLTRPYGLWAGNVFTGIVKVKGKPVPFAEVEVEYLNTDNVPIPAGPYITQVVKADRNGAFTYAMPRAGWWGFAALSEDSEKIRKDGKEYPVEIGAVIWVRTREMK